MKKLSTKSIFLSVLAILVVVGLVFSFRGLTRAATISINFERANDPSGVNVASVYQTSETNQPYRDLGLYLRNAYPVITDQVIQACGANGATEGTLATSGQQYLAPVPARPSGNMELSFSSSSSTVEKVVDNISFDLVGVGSYGVKIEFFDHQGESIDYVTLVNPFGGGRPHASCVDGAWSIKAHVTINVATRTYKSEWFYNDPNDNPDRGTIDHGETKPLPENIDNIATLRFIAQQPAQFPDGFFTLDTLSFSTPTPAPPPPPPPVNYSLSVEPACSLSGTPENRLTWIEAPWANTYSVFRDNQGIQLLSSSARSFTDTTVSGGTTYTYFVRSTEVKGEQRDTNTVQVLTQNDCGSPGPTPTPPPVTPVSIIQGSFAADSIEILRSPVKVFYDSRIEVVPPPGFAELLELEIEEGY